MAKNLARTMTVRSFARNPVALGLVLPLLVLALWQVEGQFGALPQYLPAPVAILRQWLAMAWDGELARHTGASLFRTLSGFAVGAFFGVLAGLFSAALRPVEQFYEPVISLTYPVPKIAALPIIFSWFGLGDTSKIIVIAVSVFYPCYIAARAGAKSTSRVHLWAARNMGAGQLQIIRKVLLPAALPQLFNGLRIGLALSFVVMFVSEMVSSQNGLGYLILYAQDSGRFDLVYVAILTIGMVGFLADRLLLALRSRVVAGERTVGART